MLFIGKPSISMGHLYHGYVSQSIQWPFQEPKLEVPTIYKAYIRPM